VPREKLIVYHRFTTPGLSLLRKNIIFFPAEISVFHSVACFSKDVMGDISDVYDGSSRLEAVELSAGWVFRQTDDTNEDAWMPVKKVPSTVHQDLVDNKKYVSRCRPTPRF